MANPNRLTGTFITYSEKDQAEGQQKVYKDKEITFNLADNDSITGRGRLITPQACFQMIKTKFDDSISESNTIPKDFTGYIIGKELILQIIAQEDCEGLLLLDCLNDEMKESIVVVGVDKKGDLIQADKFPVDDEPILASAAAVDIPIVGERIGKRSTESVLAEMRGNGALENKTQEEAANLLTSTFLGIK